MAYYKRFLVVYVLLTIAIVQTTAVKDTMAKVNDVMTLVSVSSEGISGNDSSSWPTISADGIYVTFYSSSTNLVPNDLNNTLDVFLHDRNSKQTSLISVAFDGTQANSWSANSSISATGRYISFTSYASNLVPGDTNNAIDIFVHDHVTGETTRVSVASDGTQGNDFAFESSISADGRYVAFKSSASNLVPNDTNNAKDIFVHDRITGQTTRVSINSDGTQGNNDAIGIPHISASGNYIAFMSSSSNLVPNDTNSDDDAFVHDRITGKTVRVSIASDGTQGNDNSFSPRISDNGNLVVFISDANNLVIGDTNNRTDIFLHDRIAGETSLVSVDSEGNQLNLYSYSASISGDGRYISYNSGIYEFSPSASYIYDRMTNQVLILPSVRTYSFPFSEDGLSFTYGLGDQIYVQDRLPFSIYLPLISISLGG